MIGFFHEYRNSQKVVAKEYDFIFYSEGAYYHQYLRDLWEPLVAAKRYRLCYITSDAQDPVLREPREGVDAFCLRSTLMFVFPRLRAKAMILTMPDLGLHGYKRSPNVGKYVYVFHALVSIHQQYHEQAFDNYDALFCCGPYHEEEARKAEALRGLKPRDLVAYGYPLLKTIADGPVLPGEKCVLVAPSWHPEGILNTCIEPLLEQLLQLELPVLIRPHPEFRKREPKKMKSLEVMIRRNPRLQIDSAAEVYHTLSAAELLVTDRSGIALEYAFARRRPVLFIDTGPKVYNRNFAALDCVPIEDRLRPELGASVAPSELHLVPAAARTLLEAIALWDKKMAALEAASIFPFEARSNGVAYLAGLSS